MYVHSTFQIHPDYWGDIDGSLSPMVENQILQALALDPLTEKPGLL